MWQRRHFVGANISKPNERRRLFWWVFKIPSHLCEACFFFFCQTEAVKNKRFIICLNNGGKEG